MLPFQRPQSNRAKPSRTRTSKTVIQNNPFLFMSEHFKHFVTVRESWLIYFPTRHYASCQHVLCHTWATHIPTEFQCSHQSTAPTLSLHPFLLEFISDLCEASMSPNPGSLLLTQVDCLSFFASEKTAFIRHIPQYFSTSPQIVLITISWPVCSFCLRKGNGLNHFQDKLVNY